MLPDPALQHRVDLGHRGAQIRLTVAGLFELQRRMEQQSEPAAREPHELRRHDRAFEP